MAVNLLRFLYRETSGKVRVFAASLTSGLSRGLLLASFNSAAAAGIAGRHAPGWLAAGFVAALVFYLASTYDAMRTAQSAVETMVERLRVRLCVKLLRTQLRFLESYGTGDLYTQLSTDLSRLSGAAMTVLGTFQASVLLTFALIYLAWLSPLAFVATALAIFLGVGVYVWQDHEARWNLQMARERQRAFFNIISDLLLGFKELKLTRSRHDGLMTHLGEVAGEYRDLSIKAETMFMVSLLTSQTFTFLLIAVLVFVLPVLFPAQGSTIFQFLSTILFLIGPVETLASAVPSISRARVALAGIEALETQLDEGTKADIRAGAVPQFGEIEFRDVHYRFVSEEIEDGFDVGPVDLDIRRGEILFVVGGNGAGKTTFLKLLTGLYPPSAGAILVDGRAIEDYQSYREMFGAVFGDFHLFRQLYGVKPSQAFADALLTQLQIENKTRVQDGELTAIHLSTGQRKRLAYAVARFLDRQIYVFDEFAADQDPAFRRYFYTELLPRLRDEGKTIVAVTHDERWFSVADRVVKMEYGRVAEIVENIVAHEGAHIA